MNIEKSFYPAEHLSEEQKIWINKYITAFVGSATGLNNVLPESREKSLCLTKLQEAKFWAIECISKNGVQNNGI